MCQPPAPNFWEAIRRLQEQKIVEVAQHGYRHILHPAPECSILGRRYGFKEKSEFAGLPLQEQVHLIRQGKKILNANGIFTEYWFAPSHSFDMNTILALEQCGFKAISDGISLSSIRCRSIASVPQQLSRAKWMPCGVFTVCLHPNTITDKELDRLQRFLNGNKHFTRFSCEVALCKADQDASLTDEIYRVSYICCWALKSNLANTIQRTQRMMKETVKWWSSSPDRINEKGKQPFSKETVKSRAVSAIRSRENRLTAGRNTSADYRYHVTGPALRRPAFQDESTLPGK